MERSHFREIDKVELTGLGNCLPVEKKIKNGCTDCEECEPWALDQLGADMQHKPPFFSALHSSHNGVPFTNDVISQIQVLL